MKRIAALVLAGAAMTARAAVTNFVDVAALVAAVDAGISETNGWTMSGIDTYADASLRFNANADRLRSPEYDADIVGVVAAVRRSESVTRWLCVADAGDGEGAELARFATCAKKDALEEQCLVFGVSAGARRIVFRFGDDGSGNTGWGIGALSVITAEPAVVPTGLNVSRTGDDWCRLSWENGAGTVSNRVDAFLVERGVGEEVLFETGFDGFYGNTTSARDFSDKIAEMLGSTMSGVRVYGARGTNGICQTGTADGLGILRHSGFVDYRGIKLRMSARRLSGCQPQTMVASELDGKTNIVETVTLTDEFEDYEIDLASVTDGAALLLGYWTPTKSNRSVQLDSLSIVRTGVDVSTPLDSRWLPASPGSASFSTKGAFALPARSECRFEVRAKNADGLVSDAASVETRIGGLPGVRLFLR